MTCSVTGCSLYPHALFSQAQSHLDKVTTLVTEAESSINILSMQDLLRLGKYHDQSKKPRPMLVRFNRAIDTSLLLSKASKLPKDIRVKPVKKDISNHFSQKKDGI